MNRGRQMRVYLTGFMAAGKTTVGRRLARALGLGFVDLDGEIERRAGLTVAEIFGRQGEAGFRRLEGEALAATLVSGGVVVATGGGTPTVAAHRELMREHGVSIWLKPPFETLIERLERGAAERPLYAGPQAARELYRRRTAAYEASNRTVEVGADEPPEQVVARLLAVLEEAPCAT